MSQSINPQFDPNLDLVLERVVDVPTELIWKAWTQPEHILKWFTPAPWKTVDCEIDLRPGGIFRTVMQSPEGQEFPNIGSYLEVVENEKLVWTNAMLPAFRPAPHNPDGFTMTAVLTFEPHANGTKYTAHVMHSNEVERKKHEEMGFHHGWGLALDQLVALMKEQ